MRIKPVSIIIIVLTTVLIGITLLTTLAPVQAATTYVFTAQWGSPGSDDGQFNRPISIAVDSSGNVYVGDIFIHRVQKFSSTGTYLAQWGSYGSGNGQFYTPSGIAVDSSGNVYVVDTGNNRVQKFSSTGTYLAQWGSYGSGNGQFYTPSGIAVDSSGNVYVVDTGNNRVQKFSSTGTYLAQWGSYGSGNGQFNNPAGAAIDNSGNIYITDFNNNRVQKFSSTGTYLAQWGSSGSGNSQFNGPFGIAVDSFGNICVGDTNNNRVQKFSSTGTYLAQWGSYGSGNGQFNWPHGIAVDSSDSVYVVDTINFIVQKFVETPCSSCTFAIDGLSSDYSGTVITIDGTQHSYGDFPLTVSWVTGTSHSISATGTAGVSATKQYVFSSWTNGNGLTLASGTFTTPSLDTTVTLTYKAQYSVTPYYTVNGGGSPTVTGVVHYTSNGVPSTATPTLGDSGGSNIWADAGSTISYTSPIAGAIGERWQITSSDSGLHQVLASVTASQTITATYYHQYYVTFGYSAAGGTTDVNGNPMPNPTAYYKQFGNDLTATALRTGSPSDWVDAGTSIQYTDSLAGFTNERWLASASAVGGKSVIDASVDASGTLNPTYYRQWMHHLQVVFTGGAVGCSSVPLTGTFLGASGTLTTLTHDGVMHAVWADTGTTFFIPASTTPINGERWSRPTSVTTSVSYSAWSYITYDYHQFGYEFSYSIADSSTPTTPTITSTQVGSPYTATLTKIATTYWLDSGSAWSITNPLSGATSTERYYSTATLSGTATAATTISPTYYHQYKFNLNYAVIGGGSPTAPTLTATQCGTDYKPKLDTSPSCYYWLDIGTPWSVNSPLDGSSYYDYWTCSQTLSGTVLATSPTNEGGSLTFTYHHYSLPLPGILDCIVVTASSNTVTAGDTVTFEVQGYDYYGTKLESPIVTYTVNGSPVTGNSVAETAAGDYCVSVTRIDALVVTTSFHVNPASLAYITIGASPTNATAGTPINLSALCFDRYNNSIKTQQVTFTVNGSPIEGSTVKETKAGDYTVSTTDNATITTATFHVNHASTDHLIVTSSDNNIAAGGSAKYDISAVDQYGNMWDASNQTVLGINCPSGSHYWVNNIVTVTKAGSWTVTASYAGLTSTVQLTVTHAAANTIIVTPTATTTPAGTPVTYATAAQDIYGNSWDVSAQTNWSADNATGGSWTNNTYTVLKAGNWTITGTYAAKSAVATLTVTPAQLDHFAITTHITAVQQSAFSITITALDAYGNTLADFTGTVALSSSTGSINPSTSGNFVGGVWTGTVTLSSQGSQTITASSNSKTGTSQAITVTAQVTPTPTLNPTVTPTPSPSPSQTPTPTTTPSSTTVIATDTTTQKTYIIPVNGNVTAQQITNMTITPNQANGTAIAFTLTGESGTNGFCNLTIPKAAIPYGTNPIIYIDGAPAANQGYTQDADNYYVWFTTHFSTHQVTIQFTKTTEQSTALWVYLASIGAIALVSLLIVALVIRKRKK